jgi:hypothetical protein
MAYLNASEREALLNELQNMNFNRARGKLRRMDPKGRLAFFRNVQNVNEWTTRYDLEGLGTRVTLVESRENRPKGIVVVPKFELSRIIVEPMPGNNT